MLKLLRDQFKNLKIVLWFVVFVFVLLIFMDWGAGRLDKTDRGMEGIAAKVGGQIISETEFLRELRSTEDRFRQMYGQQYETFRKQLDVPALTLQGMVERALLMQTAERVGLRISDQEVLDRILSFEAFRRPDGTFVGTELYARILRGSQTTPEEFEASLRQSMLLERLQQALAASVVISDAEVAAEFKRRNESVSGEALFVPLTRKLAEVTATDTEARTFYDANPSRFGHPDQWQIRYLLVDRSRLRRAITVPDSQIEQHYSSHLQDYRSEEEVRARHILVKLATPDPAGDEAALARASMIRREALKPGADFAALARQYSEDDGSKPGGGDLGFFTRERMVKEFSDAAFALEPGGISEPVKSQFGYHVIKVEERRPAAQRPLEEVREQIRTTLADALAEGEGSRRAAALREKIDAAKLTTEEQWRALADDVVTSNVTPYFERADFIPGLGREPELMAEIAAAKEGFVGGPRRTVRGWIVYRVASVRKAGVTPFEEASPQALEAVKRQRALEATAAELEVMRPGLGAGNLQTTATALGGRVEQFTDHRRGAAVSGIGASQAFDEAVFGTPVGGITPVVKLADRGAVVARISAQTLADPAQLERDRASLRESLVQTEVQRLEQAMLAEAKREQAVTINKALLARFRPEPE
ncbi:MAG TPA: peptidyl-prolyl cis-trans isomerase [Thermoanaerobaculaceae bacterium]|nr:peptidyl-prolyl cis-trans isomerase [Thermoanaerobaculaceae bacterium]HRS17141.1 peptidyl-prolyl cis-trans isomerase [Thermoanaerobaculaceae bacterium]